MARLTFASIAGAVALSVSALAAATAPDVLAGALPGLWEIDGVPGAHAPRRECVRDVLALAQYEHKGRNCARSVLSQSGNTTLIEYNCAGAGFGRSQVTAITPRSLRIETQGISDHMPFNYVLQARRIGECVAEAVAARH